NAMSTRNELRRSSAAHWAAIRRRLGVAAGTLLLAGIAALTFASADEKPVPRSYVGAPPAPEKQTTAEAARKSSGCLTCHTATDNPSMHTNTAVILGCTDCHGGDVTREKPANASPEDSTYVAARDAAHVLPRYPRSWKFPSSA